jgi:tetratricopeptide (TPR) repeat protein
MPSARARAFSSSPISLLPAILIAVLAGELAPRALARADAGTPPAGTVTVPADTLSPAQKAAQRADLDAKEAEMEQRRHDALKGGDPREKDIDSLLVLVEKSPNDYELRYKLANAYHGAGHLHSALLQYTAATRVDSTKSRAWVNRGVVLKELARTEEAEATFRKALAANPNDALAHVNLGDILLTQKKYDQAVDAYRAAIRSDPAFPNSYYSLAIAFAESGLYRDAARSWRKCAELAGSGPNADPATAERALENAKLMDEIIADADKELKERAAKKKELESGAPASPGARPKS